MPNPNFLYGLFYTLALICGLAAASAHAQEPGFTRPIENFISPPPLFASEGTLRAPYAPWPVFDHPAGQVIGRVSADLEPCPAAGPSDPCGYPRAWWFERSDGRRFELTTGEVSYEQPALLSYRAAIRRGSISWSHVEYESGAFWIRADTADVRNFESLAYWIEDIETWCTRPGACRPVSAAMRHEIGRVKAGEVQLGCSDEIYRISGIALRGAQRYYQVELIEARQGTPSLNLPKTGYIPTRRRNGAHAGAYYSRGC